MRGFNIMGNPSELSTPFAGYGSFHKDEANGLSQEQQNLFKKRFIYPLWSLVSF